IYVDLLLPSNRLIDRRPAIDKENRRQVNKFPLPEGQGGAKRRVRGASLFESGDPHPFFEASRYRARASRPLPGERGITRRAPYFANGFREGSGDCTPGRKAS